VVYHAPEGGSVKFTANSAGLLVYHNTFTSEVLAMGPAANQHYRNNLILGQGAADSVFAVETTTNYSSSDYNGFRPNPGAESSFAWTSPEFGTLVSYDDLVDRTYASLADYSEATGNDRNSVLIDYDDFVKVPALDRSNPGTLHDPAAIDFRLRPESAAIDAGVSLPGVNDHANGRAPDLGAYEYGEPLPVYGPRAAAR
jgi:hypothetical protein